MTSLSILEHPARKSSLIYHTDVCKLLSELQSNLLYCKPLFILRNTKKLLFMEKTLSLNHFSRRALLVTSLHCVFKAGVHGQHRTSLYAVDHRDLFIAQISVMLMYTSILGGLDNIVHPCTLLVNINFCGKCH